MAVNTNVPRPEGDALRLRSDRPARQTIIVRGENSGSASAWASSGIDLARTALA
jgi:hypothetical protein